MFDNVGSNIKDGARIICWIGIISACIIGGMSIYNGITLQNDASGSASAVLVAQGIVILIAGSAASWVGSLLVYGFGELVENSDIIKRNLQS